MVDKPGHKGISSVTFETATLVCKSLHTMYTIPWVLFFSSVIDTRLNFV